MRRASKHSLTCPLTLESALGVLVGVLEQQGQETTQSPVSPSTIGGVVKNTTPGPSLPNLEDVFLLNKPTIRFIPSTSGLLLPGSYHQY